MIDAPKTIEEARATRYGTWGGNPRGNGYNPARCAYEIWPPHQCPRKPGHGPGSLYCKAHAKQYAEASLTWWYLSRHLSMPTPKRIQSCTDKTVMVNGSRELRHTEWGDWFETFAAAKAHAISKARDDYHYAEDIVIRKRAELAAIEAWTEPDAKGAQGEQ